MAHIVFEGNAITNIIGEITIKSTRNYNTSPYIGGNGGSDTNFVSELGRVITFKSIVPVYDEIESNESTLILFKQLAETYKNKTGVLTSESRSDLKGNYLCTEFEVVEDTGNNFQISWQFTEVVPFNSTKKTFRVWGSAAKSTSTKKKTTTTKTSGSTANSNTKKLLKSCGTMSPSNTAKTCVKYLQKFLQAVGYYKGYKIDGKYQTYTKAAVKSLQKKYKISPASGNWNKTTINYFKKKYKLT